MFENVLIITGMHRSGTSMVAGFIHQSGIDLGDDLMGPHQSNKYGHFEDMDFYRFHRDILERKRGHKWQVVRPPRPGREEEERARELIEARRHKPCWGWKDPRTCMFLKFWDRLLPAAKYLFVARHPLSVLDSICRRNDIKPADRSTNNKLLKVWSAHNRECQSFYQSNRSRCLFVILERLVAEPEKFLSLLSERLDHQFNLELFRSSYDASILMKKQDLEPRRLSSRLLKKCGQEYERLLEIADV